MRQTSWFALALVASLIPSVAHADESLQDIKAPADTVPLSSWTATQQLMLPEAQRSTIGLLIAADTLGDRFSEVGRARLLSECFRSNTIEARMQGTERMIAWAICSEDVKKLDLKKLEAELTAGHITESSKANFLEVTKEELAKAKALGATLEESAKTDPGLAQVLKTGDSARAEWAAYISKNKTQYERYLGLLDGIRSNKGNHPAFKDCWEATQPAFSKLVKTVASKIPYDVPVGSDGYFPVYMAYVVTTPESFITTASFGACSWNVDPTGGQLFGYAMQYSALSGARGMTVKKLFDPNFHPKFADRSTIYPSSDIPFRGRLQVDASSGGTEGREMINNDGVVGTMKVNGDMTHVGLKGEMIEACTQWKEATKVEEKHCVKRGMIPNVVGETDIPTKFTAGIKPGVSVGLQASYPIVCWKSKEKKLTALFTIALP